MAFDFVAAYAESPLPFYVHGMTTGTTALTEAPQQITLRFDPGVQLDLATVAGSVNFVRAGHDNAFGDSQDVSAMPAGPTGTPPSGLAGLRPAGSVTVGDDPNSNEIVIRFASTLPDDLYRLTIDTGLKSTTGDSLSSRVELNVRLNLGAFVKAVVPQPVVRVASGLTQSRQEVHVHFNDHDALTQNSAQNVDNYRLVLMNGDNDVSWVKPSSVTYTAATSKAVLEFAPGAIADGSLYRLEIGSTLTPGIPREVPTGATGDNNSSFASAWSLGTLSADGILVTGQRMNGRPTINTPFGSLTFPNQPGTVDEPGHRDITANSGGHGLPNLDTRPTLPSWVLARGSDIPVGYFNFRNNYGFDPQGNALSNTITEAQKARTREIFEAFSRVMGIRFVEEMPPSDGLPETYIGLTVATGDRRTRLDDGLVAEPIDDGYGISGASPLSPDKPLFSASIPVAVVESNQDWGDSDYGGNWFRTAMRQIGGALGLTNSYDLSSIMGYGLTGEPVFPGDYDTIHLRQLFPAIGSDIDLYAFDVLQPGAFTAETVAGRFGPTTSFVDTLISLYREDTVGSATVRTLVARNDDYYGRDSLIGIDLEPGKYFVAVTSTGNDRFNPEVSDSGYGGRTTGPYELLLGLKPQSIANATIVDKQGTPLDGDRDGQPGGTFAFWFNTASQDKTVFVDKLATAAGANGSLAHPYQTISAALAAVESATDGSKTIVRIVGNAAQEPYLIGTDIADQPLPDGPALNVPKGVTVMIDEGAVFKLRSAIIDVGSSQPLDSTSRAGAALQVLGVPGNTVKFTSYHDDTLGTDPTSIVKPGGDDGVGPAPQGGQWGGIVFRADSDDASKRAFVNAVQLGEFRYGGGQVRVDSELESFAPIQMENARPTIAFNTIIDSAGAAIAATPNSFDVSNGRIGPEVRGNVLSEWRQDRAGGWNLHQNTTNGLSIKIVNRPGAAVEPSDGTSPGGSLDKLDVTARFKSTDIVYVIQENLVIAGGAGGYVAAAGSGSLSSRASGSLIIDPGVVVKLQNSRIELERGASQLIAEGDERNPVIFTSLGDNRFGAGGTFDTNGNILDVRRAGDWAGIVLNAGARASIDRAYVAFGGGQSPTEGVIDGFNVIEVHQGDLRLANSRVEQNLSGVLASAPATDRSGRGSNAPATVFVRGAQPIIVGNDFRTNAGAVITINANSLSDVTRPDGGRSTGRVDRFDRFDDNFGPLVAENVLALTRGVAAIAGMKVRGEEITVEGVWDDTSIAHVIEEEIIVRNFHTATGLRLLSKPGESLVVKFRGATAGLTAEGYGLDIDDRIGGTVQIVGQPGHPVILTSLADDSVGASLSPLGATVVDTGNDGTSTPQPGDWRSLKFLPMSNDRNVSIYVEAEEPLTAGIEANATVSEAERLGMLSPNFATGTDSWESAQEKSGDETRRLGFEVHGFVSPDDPTDVDVYTFLGYAGSEVWIDLDKTGSALDAMVELLDSSGNVLFRSVDGQVDAALSPATRGPLGMQPLDMRRDAWRGGDFYTTNPRDPGMRVVLPGTLGQELRYFVRVRSQPRQHDGTGALVPQSQFETRLRSTTFDQPGDPAAGVTSGRYELRIRLRQRDEKPGSVVRYADIRYPTIGVDVLGLPRSSLLASETGEAPAANGVFAQAQYVGNLLTSDRNTISVSGAITDATDVDWYRISLTHDELRTLGGATSWSTVFDLDYADGFRGDLTLSVFDQDGRLIFVGSDSDVIDDQPGAGQGADFDDLSRGSIGKLDPFIGSVQMPAGNPANLVLATAAPTPFGSTTVRVAAGLINLPGVGALVAGPGIAGGTTVVAVDAGTRSITLSKPTAAVITADTDLSFISGGARDYYVAVSSNTRLPSAIAGTFGVNRPSGQSVRVQLTSAQTAIGASAITLADVTGIAVGMTVSGTGIVEGTTVLAVNTVTRAISISRLTTATIPGGTALSFAADRVAYVELATLGVTAVGATSVTLANVPEVAGVEAGMTVTGTGMAAGTTVAAVNQATRVVTLSGQTTGPIPAGSRLALSWPGLARLEPINSLRRIAEDHIGSTGYFSGGGNPPVGDVKLAKIDPDMGGTPLIDVTSPTSLDLHVRPFRFGDVTLFVSTAGGVATYDPVTGALETTLGSGSSIGDLDIRTDGRLFAYSGVTGDRTTVGRLDELDTGTGAVIFSDFDEIEDRVPTTPTTPPAYQTTSDSVTALAFRRTGTTPEGAAAYEQLWFIVQDGSQSKLYRAADGGTGAAGSNPDAKADQTQSDIDFGYRGRIAVDINGDGDSRDFDERPLVTGLQFADDTGSTLYGVTSTGKVIAITPGTKPQQPTLDTVDYESTATLVIDLLPELQKIGATGFTALAAAPRNLYGGTLAGKFFALTNTGRLALIDVNNIPGAQMPGTLGILTDTGATGGFVTVIGSTDSLTAPVSRTGVSQFDVTYAAGDVAITVVDANFTGFEAATLVNEMIVVAPGIDPGTYLDVPPDSLDPTAALNARLSNPTITASVAGSPTTFIEPTVIKGNATLAAGSSLVDNIDTTGVSRGMVVFAATPDGDDPDTFVELGGIDPNTGNVVSWLPVGTLVESVSQVPTSATGQIRLTQSAPLAASNATLRFIRPDALLTTDRDTGGNSQIVVSQTALIGLEVRPGMQVFGRGVPFNTTVSMVSAPDSAGLVTISLTNPLVSNLARNQLVAFVDGRTLTLAAGANVQTNMLVLDESISDVFVKTTASAPRGSVFLTVDSVAATGLVAGMRVTGTGIPVNTRFVSVVSVSGANATIRLSNPTQTILPLDTPVLFTSDARTVRPSTIVQNAFTDADGTTSVVVSRPVTDSRLRTTSNAGLRFISPLISDRSSDPLPPDVLNIDASGIEEGMYIVGYQMVNGVRTGDALPPFGAIANTTDPGQDRVRLSFEQQSGALPNVGPLSVYVYDVSGGTLKVDDYVDDVSEEMVVVSTAVPYNTIVTQVTPTLVLSKTPSQNTTNAEFSLLDPERVSGFAFLTGVAEDQLNDNIYYETINFSRGGVSVVDVQRDWIAIGEYIFPGTRVTSVDSVNGNVVLSQAQNITPGTLAVPYQVRFLEADYQFVGTGALNSEFVTITGSYPATGQQTPLNLHVGMIVMGHGIPYNTRIKAIIVDTLTNVTRLTLDKSLAWSANPQLGFNNIFQDSNADGVADGQPFDGILSFFRDGRVISRLTLPTSSATTPLIPGMVVQLDRDLDGATDDVAVIKSVGPGAGEVRLERAIKQPVSDPTNLIFQNFVRASTTDFTPGASASLDMDSVLGIVPGMTVSGLGIATGTTVVSVTSTIVSVTSTINTVTLSLATQSSIGAGTPMLFEGLAPTGSVNYIGKLQDTTVIQPGMLVFGENVQQGTTVVRLLNSTTVQVSDVFAGNELESSPDLAFVTTAKLALPDLTRVGTLTAGQVAVTLPLGTSGIRPGMLVFVAGDRSANGSPLYTHLPFNTRVLSVNPNGTMTLTLAAKQTLSSATLEFVSTSSTGFLTDWGNSQFSPVIAAGGTGIAFSPLDVNLWHTTERRRFDEGHGIESAPDNSRPLVPGGKSMYFGLETWPGTPTSYDIYSGQQGQFGVLSADWQRDLTVGTGRGDTYDLPGGAFGSLTTNSFSLQGSTYTQKPTLYFNYWLQTENALGDTASRAMRDSARVFISKDSGTTWELIATNNSQRGSTNTELPWGPSASSRLNRDDPRQVVQELFDSGSWRQARIDLGDYVGQNNLQLRFDFHTAGQFDPAGDPTGPVSGFASATGNFNSSTKGQFNRFEGFYVDDIIVGLAGRGEMVTGASPGDTEFVTVNEVPGAPRQVLDGPYQLEIRRGTDYASVVKDSSAIMIDRRFTIDERLIPSLAAAGAGGLRGDSSPAREQGQFVVESNFISYARDYGISIDAGARDARGLIPHPGSAQNYATLNGGRLVPGAFVVNNVVELSAPGSLQGSLAGIRFSGDAEPGDVPPAVVPHGRIVNNTIYGGTTARGTGITVTDNAGPTVINNLFANLATGVAVDASSLRDAANNERTVVLHSAFFNTTAQVTGATPRFSVPTLTSDPFEGASNRNFYLRPGTAAIDTSLDSLQDRTEFVVVKSPLGVPPAPVRAPEKDLYGQLRADDPSQSPSVPGLGANAFKDIGAIDRVDFSLSPPFLAILNPLDNGPADGNPLRNAVALEGEAARTRTRFTLQITDRGAGINRATVTSGAFQLWLGPDNNRIRLVPNKDYVFTYLESTNQVVFTAASVFQPGIYRLVVDRTVKDLAGNSLRPTNTAGGTEFLIDLLDVPQAPTWPAASSLLAGWHESQTVYLAWNTPFTVRPILDYDVEMSLDAFLTPGLLLTPDADTTATTLSKPGLTNGAQYWFRVRATNALGSSPWSDILGPIVPQPKPSIALAADTGSSPTDGITKNGLVNIAGVAANAIWQYRVGTGAWTTGTGTSFALADAVYPAGTVQLRQIVSGFPGVPATNATQWEVDTAAPAAPSITSVIDSVTPVTGPITNGGSTDDPTPTFTGTVTAGTSLSVSINGNAATLVPFSGSAWMYMPTLANGTHTFSFVATDSAGNQSIATTFALTVIPKAPVITSVIDDMPPVTGPIPNGGTTNDARPTFSGTIEPGTLLSVSRNGSMFNQIPVNPDGSWTWARGNDLPNGTHTFSFVATDATGNVSTATTFTLTVDVSSPQPPVITSVTDNVSPGTSPITNGGSTNDPTPTFNGTVEAGTTLAVSINSGTPTTVPFSGGSWTYTPSSLTDRTYTFSFVATDAAGNVSTATIFIVTVDTVAPIVAPPVTASSPSGTYGMNQSVDIQVSFSKVVMVTGNPALRLNTTPSRTATYVSGSGTSVLTFRYAIQTGDRATRLDYASASALILNGGSILSAAALPATLTLPAPGGFFGKNIVIDALIKATVTGLGLWPATPDFNSPVNTFQLQFNAAITGFTVGSFKLQRLADPADPASGRDVSLAGVSISGTGTSRTITLPSSTNPTSLPGRYKLIIGGLGSGIDSAGVAMDVASEWFFDRI
jgi:hypothetical protein